MKKIVFIGLALAAALGAGVYVFNKSKSTASTDELIQAPVLEEKAESQLPVGLMEAPVAAEAPPPAPQAEEKAPAKAKAKVKASSGHFEMARGSLADDDAAAGESPGYGKAREKRLWSIFKTDKDLVQSIQVTSIHCRVDTCVVEAQSKDGDPDRFQSLMFALIKQYPWLGNKIDVTTPEQNPAVARYVYFQETPK